jgi:hypothetical protein
LEPWSGVRLDCAVLTAETPYVAEDARIEIDPLRWTDD